MTLEATATRSGLKTPVRNFERDSFTITTDRSRIDAAMVHGFLTDAPWSKGISKERLDRALRNSFCFSVFEAGQQIGFARVVTDFATFAYVCDFFIVESHRGRGLAKWLISCILECPEIAGLHRKCIVTAEAHGLYRQMGFMGVQRPEAYLEVLNQDGYK